SRRRHTRFSRDWSSDVCSSDLTSSQISLDQRKEEKFSFEKQLSWKHAQRKWNRVAILLENPFQPLVPLGLSSLSIIGSSGEENRSEERRVGKGCRYDGVTWNAR